MLHLEDPVLPVHALEVRRHRITLHVQGLILIALPRHTLVPSEEEATLGDVSVLVEVVREVLWLRVASGGELGLYVLVCAARKEGVQRHMRTELRRVPSFCMDDSQPLEGVKDVHVQLVGGDSQVTRLRAQDVIR